MAVLLLQGRHKRTTGTTGDDGDRAITASRHTPVSRPLPTVACEPVSRPRARCQTTRSVRFEDLNMLQSTSRTRIEKPKSSVRGLGSRHPRLP